MSTILVSLDDSGDPGSSIGSGSSPLLVVGIAVFAIEGSANTATERIQRLRRELRRPNQEFRYAKNDKRTRAAFVAAAAGLPFTYYASVLRKETGQGESGAALFVSACTRALVLLADVIPLQHQITVVYDETTRERKVKRHFESNLRKSVHTMVERDLIHKITARDSRASELVQIADYVAGIVSRAERGDEAATAFRRQWAAREGKIWRGPA